MTRLHTFIGPYLIPGPRRVAVARVQQVVADAAGIPLEHMRSRDRRREYTRPRQIAMTLARRHSRHSLTMIGKLFGGRDHSTVCHAIRAVAAEDMRRFEVMLEEGR